MPYYQPDLAYIHDEGFGGFAKSSAAGILEILRKAGIREGLIVDLGCGSGIWAERLIREGYQVVGVDQSEAMIRLARERCPTGQFEVGSFLATLWPNCQAITAMGEVFNYAFDKKNSLPALEKLFRRAFRSLAPGGALIFDLALPGRSKGERQRFFDANDWTCLVEYSHDDARHRLTRRIITFRRNPSDGRYVRSEEVHALHLFAASDVTAALRRAGFRVRITRRYGENIFPKAYLGFIGFKPA